MSYDLPKELTHLDILGKEFSFSLKTGTVLSKNYLEPASDAVIDTEIEVIKGTHAPIGVQEQVWLKDSDDKEFVALVANADPIFNEGNEMSFVIMYQEDFDKDCVMIYNHTTDQDFNMYDVDDVRKMVNINNRNLPLEVIWYHIAQFTFVLGILGIFAVHNFIASINYMVLFGAIVAMSAAYGLSLKTIIKLGTETSKLTAIILAFGGCSIVMLTQTVSFGEIITLGLLSGCFAFSIMTTQYISLTKKIADMISLKLAKHWRSIVEFADKADGSERTWQTPIEVTTVTDE